MQPLSLAEARWWARAGLFAALALVLGYIETFIPLPVPVPGVKLGLANVAVLVAFALLDARAAAVVALVKVLATGFLFGNPLMMAYSFAGTLLAFAAMAGLMRVRGLSVVLVAVVAAIAHNAGQLVVASVLLGTPLVWASAPVLVVAACATGAASGAVVRFTLQCLGGAGANRDDVAKATWRRVGNRGDAESPAQAANGPRGVDAADERSRSAVSEKAPAGAPFLVALDVRFKLLFLVALVICALHARSALSLAACLATSLALAVAARVDGRRLLKAAGPLVTVVVFTVVMQVLYFQQGTVLFAVAGLSVTSEALIAAARLVAGLACMLTASVAFMRCTSVDDLVAALDWSLGPLRAIGVQTGGFMLSLSLALRFVPVLVGDFGRLKAAHAARGVEFEGGLRARLRAYAHLFAPLARSSLRRSDTLAEAVVSRCFTASSRLARPRACAFGAREAACVLAAFMLVVVTFAL